MTLEKYGQKETEITTFRKALCYLWLKQRTYYADVKENFNMEVTVVSWVWDCSIKNTKWDLLEVDFYSSFNIEKWFMMKNFSEYIVQTQVGFRWTLANFCPPMSGDRLFFVAMVLYIFLNERYVFWVVLFPFYCRTPMLSWSETWELK